MGTLIARAARVFASVFIFIFILISGLESQALISEAECPSVDLTTEFEFGPVRSQRQLGWCYAYATSDLVSYRVGRTVSPFDIALSVYKNRDHVREGKALRISTLSGANIKETLLAIQQYGVCDGSRFSAEGEIAARNLPKVETMILEIFNEFASGRPNEAALLESIRASAVTWRTVFPSTSSEELLDALATMKNEPNPIFSLVDTICGERLRLPEMKYGWDASANKVVSMRAQLEKRRPLYISYSEKSIDNLDQVGRFGHASSVVGMRFDKISQKCEFKIRNSYGAAWPQKANKRLEGKYADGYVWLDEENMNRITGIVAWIE